MDPPIDYGEVDGLDPEISGEAFLTAGERRTCRASFHMDTTVFGRMDLPAGADAETVESSIALFGMPGLLRERESRGILQDEAEFRFEGIVPGAKLLRFSWRDTAGGVVTAQFASRAVTLAPDESKDLGLVAPRATGTAAETLVFRVHPPRGSSATGGTLSARLHTKSTGSVGKHDRLENVSADLSIPIGQVFRLIGLPAGQVRIIGEFEESGLLASDGWPKHRMWTIDIPRKGVVDLYTHEETARIRVDMSRTSLEQGVSWDLLFLDKGTRRVTGRILGRERPESLMMDLAVGTYDVLVIPSGKSSSHWGAAERGTYWRKNDLRIDRDATIDVWPLLRAYRVEGRVAGKGKETGYLGFSLDGWPEGFAVFKVAVEDGAFVLPCVPGDCVLTEVVAGSGAKIVVTNEDVSGVKIGR
jgi:hypothetical protein